MTFQSDILVQQYAEALTQGARLALMRMTGEWQRATTRTFNGNGAYYLWENHSPLCEMEKRASKTGWRATRHYCHYRLTPLGLKVQAFLRNNSSKYRQ